LDIKYIVKQLKDNNRITMIARFGYKIYSKTT